MTDAINKWVDLNTALTAFLPVVKEYRRLRRTFPTMTLELEGRIGTMKNGQFEAGVPFSTIDTAMKLMESNSKFRVEDWKEFQDFFYVASRQNVRTRCMFDPNELEIQTHTVHKKVLQNATVLFKDGLTCFRLSLSEELPVTDLPITANTTLVRISQRRSVQWNNTWQYDFTMTWSGQTKTIAEQSKASVEPKYTIEVELTSDSYATTHSDEHIAESFIHKLLFLQHNSNFSKVFS